MASESPHGPSPSGDNEAKRLFDILQSHPATRIAMDRKEVGPEKPDEDLREPLDEDYRRMLMIIAENLGAINFSPLATQLHVDFPALKALQSKARRLGHIKGDGIAGAFELTEAGRGEATRFFLQEELADREKVAQEILISVSRSKGSRSISELAVDLNLSRGMVFQHVKANPAFITSSELMFPTAAVWLSKDGKRQEETLMARLRTEFAASGQRPIRTRPSAEPADGTRGYLGPPVGEQPPSDSAPTGDGAIGGPGDSSNPAASSQRPPADAGAKPPRLVARWVAGVVAVCGGAASTYGLFNNNHRLAALSFIGMLFAITLLLLIQQAIKETEKGESTFYRNLSRVLTVFFVLFFMIMMAMLFPDILAWLRGTARSSSSPSAMRVQADSVLF